MTLTKQIPNLFTLLNLAAGFAAILLNEPIISCWLIVLAGFFDLLDGTMARVLDAGSPIGEQLDSFSDLVSFGVAPAYLFFHHVASPAEPLSYLVILFPIFGAVRLAIFNLDDGQDDHFKGLPIPSAGYWMMSVVFISATGDTILFPEKWLWFFPLFLSLLMVSRIKMMSLKKIGAKALSEKVLLLVLCLCIVVLILWKNLGGIYLIIWIYLLLSLINFTLFKRKQANQA